MAKEHEVKKALGAKGERKGAKLHTDGVTYRRAHNGGIRAEVHRHTGTPGGADSTHHHTEQHILPDLESSQEHMQEHLGDQPPAGEMEPQQTAAPPDPEAAGGAAAGM